MNPAVAPLAAILDLNTDLLLNCLEGVSEAEAQRRLQGGGNSLAFLIAHLTDTRHFMATRLKRPLANRLTPLLADAQSIDDIRGWPPLDDLQAAWRAISDHLATVLPSLTAEELSEPNLGQAAFLRRQIGKSAMAYTRGSRPVAATRTV